MVRLEDPSLAETSSSVVALGQQVTCAICFVTCCALDAVDARSYCPSFAVACSCFDFWVVTLMDLTPRST
jgi:hypothetical protein